MAIFCKKNLAQTKRVCFRLKEARKERGFSLSELAEITKINIEHLKALEACRFSDIPHAKVYQKNFVRRYAEAIGLDPKPVMEQFCSEEEVKEKNKPVTAKRRVRSSSMQNLPFLLRGAVIFTLVFTVVTYLGWQVKSIIEPPPLTVHTPHDGYVTDHGALIVQGETSDNAQVYINGESISTEGNGIFEQMVNLSPGINTITISAKKKHGKESRAVRHVIVKQNRQLSFIPSG